MPSVLIVDDLTAIHEMLAAVIQPTGYAMAFADNGEDALKKYKAEKFDVVLADISMQPMDGIALLQFLKSYDPQCVVIMMTGYASTDTAIRALKHGAFDYIQKPFKIDELIQTLKRAVDYGVKNRVKPDDGPSSGQAASADLSSRIVGKSARVQRLRQQLSKLMNVHTPVLIEGEPGTGKKTVAEVVHHGGDTSAGPFILIDCGLSSEAEMRTGLVGDGGHGGDWLARAKGGTLFLRNIDQMPFGIQEALVAVIKRTINETRLICSSRESLEALVDEGRFNDELFYRIATLPVVLPPLRDHLEDLPLLVRHFLDRSANGSFEGAQIEFDAQAMEAMRRYSWPNNLLELGQVVTAIASTTEQRVIGADQLPGKFTPVEQWRSLEVHLAEESRRYIRRVLRACSGDKEKAARVLGCSMDQIDPASAGS